MSDYNEEDFENEDEAMEEQFFEGEESEDISDESDTENGSDVAPTEVYESDIYLLAQLINHEAHLEGLN